MSQTPREIVRPGFLLALLIAFGLLFIIANLLPSHVGSRKAKLPQVLGNLKQIEIGKQMWASDHAASNGVAVSESDLVEYLRPRQGSAGLVASVDGEAYRPNAIGTPPEARLERPLGTRFPAGTLLRWSTNAGYEVLLPNHSVERMGASRSGQRQFGSLRRLAPSAHAYRSA